MKRLDTARYRRVSLLFAYLHADRSGQPWLRITEVWTGGGTLPAWHWRAVHWLVGLVLITSSALKLHFLLTVPPISAMVLDSPPIQWLLVGAEAALAVWLISGTSPKASRAVAIGAFSVLALFSAMFAVIGHPSCCCFGVLKVAPLAVSGLDVLLVLTLIAHPIPSCGRFVCTRSCASTITLIVAASFLTAGITFAAASLRRGEDVPFVIVGWPEDGEPWTVTQGSFNERVFRVLNNKPTVVRIGDVETSCECFHVQFSFEEIPPGAASEVRSTLDLTARPGFRGDLVLRVAGWTSCAGEKSMFAFSRAVSVANP